ncbi:MAG: metal ABC transporter permease [Oligoflexia bacterium]|nr:metal ABC transporter permease [Oligoflexia bacterium]
MIAPFAACLVLTGMHAYLGLHVIERQVIFVDLALAQIAALGATVAYLFGFGLHSPGSYFTSLIFALTGAVILTFTRSKKERVPHEALIGIVYVVSAAASILVLSRSPEGGEELKSLLVGHLLFVNWGEIIKVGLIYGIIGIVHWVFRRRFLLISQAPLTAYQEGLHVRFWDFIFYCTFALVVTSSVEIAGVLLVFAFLVVPAVSGMLAADSIRGRLAIGWISGVLTSVFGVTLSYYGDLPTGATVVCTYLAPLLACAIIGRAARARVDGSAA